MTNESLLRTIASIGNDVARAHAEDVDRTARFPSEALHALKEAGALGAYVPVELGGAGCKVSALGSMCTELGRHCASTAMILAMHQIQVACLVRHGRGTAFFDHYLAQLTESPRLIASVTSEVGIGGDMRTSRASVVPEAAGFVLHKDATTISYGAFADDLLITARRHPDAAAGDQVLVLLRQGEFTLEPTSAWDTLGMRGTCSPGFQVRSAGRLDQILPLAFGDVANQTMVPFAHLLWASVWLGIATDAFSRARQFVQQQARKTVGHVPPTAQRLAHAAALLQTMRSVVGDAMRTYDDALALPEADERLGQVGFALRINHVKTVASELVVQIVHEALAICGIHGYRNDSPFSLGRHLRDAHSAALMIGNDRIVATNASLLLVHKGD